jgi:hypothetical protein
MSEAVVTQAVDKAAELVEDKVWRKVLLSFYFGKAELARKLLRRLEQPSA